MREAMRTTAPITATDYPLAGFPMRPTPGPLFTARNILRIVRDLAASGFLIQPKLNGDRVLLRKTAGQIEAYNRHGSRYGHNLDVTGWTELPDDTLLDGEAWQGRFWPFEALEIAGNSLAGECVSIRATAAKDFCRTLGHAYLFDRPADAWLRLCRENLPAFEGIVAKRIGSPYKPIKKPFHKSAHWVKLKWQSDPDGDEN